MRPTLFLIPALLSSAACSSQSDYVRETGIKGDPASVATARASASAAAAEAVQIKQSAEKDGGDWEFAYSWPKAVSAQPELAKQLGAEKDKTLAAERAEWEKQLSELKGQGDCGGCRGRSFGKTWEVVADLPGWLSLSANFETYTGGAHGMYGTQSLVWDKANKVSMDGVALFQSPAALQNALGQSLCDALNKERLAKGMEPITDPDSTFPACPGIDEATVLVGSSNRKTFDRITVYYGPYVAGSYAEGAYELDFPMTAAMVAAVKPAYRGAFSALK
jgi:hypothetical protein